MNDSADLDVDDAPVEAIFSGVDQRRAPSPAGLNEARQEAHAQWQAMLAARHQRKRQRLLGVAAGFVLVGIAIVLALAMRVPKGAEAAFELVAVSGTLALGQGASEAQPIIATVAQPVLFRAGPETSVRSSSAALLRTPEGAEVRLAAGSEVRWLDTGKVQLIAGAIYVDTHERSDFSVRSALALVEDVGTRYLVKLVPAGMEVAVRSGSVNVKTGATRHQAVATAQESAVVEVSNTQNVREFMEPASAPRWQWIHEAPTGYESPRVAEVLSAIARDLGKALQYASVGDQAMLANATYSGNLAGLEPLVALRLLAGSQHFDWQESGTELVIHLLPE